MSTTKNLASNYIGQLWVALMGIAFVPIYIRYLGIDSYGLIGFFATVTICLNLLDMGLMPALTREMSFLRFQQSKEKVTSALSLLRAIEVLIGGAAIIFVFACLVTSSWAANNWFESKNLNAKEIQISIILMGVIGAIRLMEGIYKSAIIGLQKQVILNIVNILIATLRGIGGVLVLIFVAPTLEAFFLWQLFTGLISLLVLNRITYSQFTFKVIKIIFSIQAILKIKNFIGGILFINVLTIILTQTDKIILSKALELNEYGYYSLAGVVAGGLFLMVNPIAQAFYPKFSELYNSRERKQLVRAFHLSAQLVSVFMGSTAVVLIFFSYEIINLWTSSAILSENSYTLLSLLAVGNLLNGLYGMPYQLQLAYGWTKLVVLFNLVMIIVLVPSTLYFVKIYGSVGAAYIWIFLNLTYLLVASHFMFRKILKKEKFRWLYNDIILPLAPIITTSYIIKNNVLFTSNVFENFFIFISIIIFSIILSMSCSNIIREILIKRLKIAINNITY